MIRTIFAFLLLTLVFVSCDEEETDYGPIDKKKIEDYLKANNLSAQSTESGLYYIIDKPGGTNHPTKSSKVSVNYKGYLLDGTVFDQSYTNGQPSSFNLSGVIAAWREGIPLIGVGGKIKLLVPSELGYGSNAQSKIPANSVLIFDVELVDFY
jgi:FKBP-type peptidyl-prolyl cis-trans isomerase FkpA